MVLPVDTQALSYHLGAYSTLYLYHSVAVFSCSSVPEVSSNANMVFVPPNLLITPRTTPNGDEDHHLSIDMTALGDEPHRPTGTSIAEPAGIEISLEVVMPAIALKWPWVFGPTETFILHEEKVIPSWERFVQPEGQIYFLNSCRRFRYLTEANLYDPETLAEVEDVMTEIERKADMFSKPLPANTEVLLELADKSWSYYMMDLDRCCIFWLDDYDAQSLIPQLFGIGKREHLRHALDLEYWQHIEHFPCHRKLKEGIMEELLGVLSYSNIGARLASDQSTRGKDLKLRSWLIKLLSPVLFYAPDTYLAKIEYTHTDGIINKSRWTTFQKELEDDWDHFVILVTIPSVQFTNGQALTTSVAAIPSVVSVITSLGSIIIGLLLGRRFRVGANEAGGYFRRRKDIQVGHETVAIHLSLPYALLMWSISTFLIAITIFCFLNAGNNIPSRATYASMWLFTIVLLVWTIFFGMELHSRPDRGPVYNLFSLLAKGYLSLVDGWRTAQVPG
ncbi:hypothetical protein EW145_g2704 [Phellinidium pouzarii]|uniref:WW domain-containing protein n=1 Tax=Phellinidium pouzarii TaxID=167371 RepID=A0A4S4LBF6_9AGAM|nr:hypothetical protein EW145_g2704 [Phellinidium pouzarii]